VNYLQMLLRAKQLAKRPPAPWRIKLYLGVIAACLLIIGIETFVGWPDWLTVDKGRLIP
jgi:hypothetical protein